MPAKILCWVRFLRCKTHNTSITNLMHRLYTRHGNISTVKLMQLLREQCPAIGLGLMESRHMHVARLTAHLSRGEGGDDGRRRATGVSHQLRSIVAADPCHSQLQFKIHAQGWLHDFSSQNFTHWPQITGKIPGTLNLKLNRLAIYFKRKNV
jgi:hypothetical protein